jgi:hypothetical protein
MLIFIPEDQLSLGAVEFGFLLPAEARRGDGVDLLVHAA